MVTLYSFFDTIGESFYIIYSVALLVAVYKYREMNSTIIVVALLLCIDCISGYIKNPLLSLGSWEAWYGGWIVIDVLLIFLIYEAHRMLKVSLTKFANTVALAQLCSMSVQTVRYIERSFFDGQQFDTWYYLAINSINVSVAIIVVMTVLRQKEEKHVGLYI